MEPQKSLEELREDVKRARAWADVHFNVNQVEDHVFAPPCFTIEWLAMDRMRVWPRAYGHRLTLAFEYKLGWIDGEPTWITTHPFTQKKITLKVGTYEEIAAEERRFAEAREKSRQELQGCLR